MNGKVVDDPQALEAAQPTLTKPAMAWNPSRRGRQAVTMLEGRHSFEPISQKAGPDWMPWAYCRDELHCGHNVRLDLPALIARYGDMPSDRFRMRLRCSKCGGRARLVIGWKG